MSGHPIFRNQPPYTYFNKSFEDPTDALFLDLNEIDSHFLQPEQLQNEIDFQTLSIKDPRTQQNVLTFYYDHTVQPKPKIFCGGSMMSCLTKQEHLICIRVLQAWREQGEVPEKDKHVWNRTEPRRLLEKHQLFKLIYDYSLANKEQMFAPAEQLVKLYKNWYQSRVGKFLIAHAEEVAYNTYAGMPHVRVCKSLLEQTVVIKNAELVARKGRVQVWQPDINVNFKQLQHKLDIFAEIYNDEAINVSELLEEVIEAQLQAKPHNCSRIYVPLDTILFLLTSGDYEDLPNEVLLEIGDHGGKGTKTIRFEEPIPSRHCGWHTHKQVVEQAYSAYISVLDSTKWLNVENEYVTEESVDAIAEIVAFTKQPQPFQPIRFEEFLQDWHTKFKPLDSRVKQNCVLIKWQLQQEDVKDYLELYTTLALPPALDAKATEFLGSYSIKLEFKPHFGCEVMTKHELISEWLRMSLLKHCAVTTTNAMRLRIATETFETQLMEQSSLPHIEQQLTDFYHVNMPQLLTNLSEFFKILLNMPAGKYMLRYNPKFKDKLMLCAPAKEITQNTIFLRSLLQTEPSDMLFMTQLQFLPVEDHLCSVVHLHHNVLPCAFLPVLPHHKSVNLKKKGPPVITDQNYVQIQVRQKAEKKRAKGGVIKTEIKLSPLTRKKKRRKQKKKKQAQANAGQEKLKTDT